MSSFGERMQRERELRRITLEEISEHTKISTRNLRFLEKENFNQLPGGIFNKGFVRAYANYLGIDADQAVADFVAAEAESVREKSEKSEAKGNNEASDNSSIADDVDLLRSIHAAKERSGTIARRNHFAGFMKAAVTVVLLLGAGGFVYKFLQARKAAPTLTEAPAGRPAAPTANAAVQNAKPSPAQSANVPASTVKVPNSPAPSNMKIASVIPALVPTVHAATPELGGGTARVNLRIRTKEESWVQVTADGKLLMEGLLSASANKSFVAEKELVVKLGNAGGVELSYNGRSLPAFDPERRTRTLTFTADGIQQ